jgi:RNA polymerase sigma-70 factor (ECF subfamily)
MLDHRGRAGCPFRCGMMTSQPSETFVAHITAVQQRLHGFVRTLVYERDAIEEIIQETNLALWQQSERFRPGSNFAAWACEVAWFKVLDHRRRRKVARIRFADTLVETLAAQVIEKNDELDRERAALEECVSKLSDRHSGLLTMHYEKRLPLTEIAATMGNNANAVAQMLHRVRASLRECVRRRLSSATP